jgi:hypothetical protein
MPGEVYRFSLRNDLAANWAAKNPILLDGEPGVERVTNRFKIGDGATPWLDLPYYLSEDAVSLYINQEIAKLPPLGPEQMGQIVDQVSLELEVSDLVLLWLNAKQA